VAVMLNVSRVSERLEPLLFVLRLDGTEILACRSPVETELLADRAEAF